MDFDTSRLLVQKGERIDLDQRSTRIDRLYRSEDDYESILAGQVKQLHNLQEKLYADNRHAVLVVLQGMDTSGKDGIIRHVMSGINPHGCQVASFQQPSKLELSHDFLWRTNLYLPERGNIGVFNRSYYEEVLVVRVHPEYLKAQYLPNDLVNSKSIWENRYESIRDHEKHLNKNGRA